MGNTMGNTRRFVALLAALLLLGFAAAARADGGVVEGTTVSGTVRVYLSSIRQLTRVDLTVDGSYSIGGDTSRAIARGTRLTVSNSGGTLRLAMNGQTQTMGSRFKLRRHQTSGENGVRIAQARYPGSLYPGDVEFIANGGCVQIIVHVYMEDYMRGVLPYEMDNSFPLEALKAQAVAARTYALKKMSAQAAAYDVVDTTSDQVYNGTPSGNARVAQAVEETACIIGTVGGDYMASYYTASNGGQTESVANAWGSGSYSYLQVKDDPYDLRNAASVAKSVTFYRDGTTSLPALTQLLRTEAALRLGASSVQIEAITSVTPHTPKYAPPSRVYTKVDVGLRLAGYGEVTVTLDYFSQIEGLCGMSINVLKNETVDVTEVVSGYKLTARRFGHGVGMSQRGAQQMAAEGLTYDQILEFYYPGLVRTRYTMTRTILPAMDGTAAQPDGPVSEGRTAIVTLSNPLGNLNLRREPNTASPVLASMPHGTQVTLLEMGAAWSRVQYGTLSGYVSNAYISVEDDGAVEEPPPERTHGTAVVTLQDESQTLNLRAAPTLGAAVIAKLRHEQTLTVLERYESWTYVQHGALKGYVSNTYIAYDSAGGQIDAPQQTPPTAGEDHTMQATVKLQSDASQLNLREGKSLSARVLARIPNGERVTVTEWGEEWCAAQYGGASGYCATGYLRFDGGDANGAQEANGAQDTAGTQDANEPENANGANGTEGADGTQDGYGVAIVLPSSGLNLRASASRASGVIMLLPQGTTLSVLGAAQDGMLPVSLGTIRGYVAEEYVYVTGAALYAGTLPPQQTATPAPVETERRARVTASGLTLRAGPGTEYEAVATMPRDTVVLLTGEETAGFYPVLYGELDGYASARYLSLVEVAEAPGTPAPDTSAPDTSAQGTSVPDTFAANTPVPEASGPVQGRTATVTAASGLNLRDAPSQSGAVLATLGYGVSVTVVGDAQDGFYPVRVGTLSGYASASFLSFGEAGRNAEISQGQQSAPDVQSAPNVQSAPDGQPVPDGTETQPTAGEGGQAGIYRVVVASDNGLNLRASPDGNGEVIYVLPYGMVLEVLSEAENGYLRVRWDDYDGYVSGQYVTPFGNP